MPSPAIANWDDFDVTGLPYYDSNSSYAFQAQDYPSSKENSAMGWLGYPPPIATYAQIQSAEQYPTPSHRADAENDVAISLTKLVQTILDAQSHVQEIDPQFVDLLRRRCEPQRDRADKNMTPCGNCSKAKVRVRVLMR